MGILFCQNQKRKNDIFMLKYVYKISFVLIVFSLLFNFSGCVDSSNKNPIVTILIDENNKNIGEDDLPISGEIKIELFPDKAPNSVSYFLDFITNGVYNGFPVSKALDNGVVTFGDPWMIKQIRTEIKGEFKENGFEQNDIEFKRGTVALDRFLPDDYDSASGDFFVLLDDEGAKQYQGKYAAIGQVVSGIEVLDAISHIKVYPNDYSPMFGIEIKNVNVNLNGKSYNKPVVYDRRTYPGMNID